ncbi:MAG: hypothetical protein NTX50_02305, partial [Candidatus Sumerlaeota bacterium]|nr:hypothetical protein [Candidatus Sumerlaeota bacterium]
GLPFGANLDSARRLLPGDRKFTPRKQLRHEAHPPIRGFIFLRGGGILKNNSGGYAGREESRAP